MSTKENAVSTTPKAVSNNNYAEIAQERVNEIRSMRDRIPHFIVPASKGDTLRLRSAASVPPEFVELTNLAVANEQVLVRGGASSPAEIRDRLSYAEAFDPVADELEALAQFVRHSVTAARNEAGSEALTTYSLAQRLAKRPATAHLLPYVADMRRALDRRRKLSPEVVAQKAANAAARAAEKAAKAAAKVTKTP